MVTLSTALPLLQAASTCKKFQSSVAHLGCDSVQDLEKYCTCERRAVRTIAGCFRGRVIPREPTGNRRCRVQTLGHFSVITANLRTRGHRAPHLYASTPPHPALDTRQRRRDQEREAHTRSSQRNADAQSVHSQGEPYLTRVSRATVKATIRTHIPACTVTSATSVQSR